MMAVVSAMLIFNAATTKPSDLVNLLSKRTGHAFIPITQSHFAWSTNRSRRDEIAFANYASNRWGLAVSRSAGYARGITVPVNDLFDPLSTDAPKVRSDIPVGAWNTTSGFQASVAEVLQAGKIPSERCHWAYLKRLVLVRFDPNKLEDCLPDLASAVGGSWNVHNKVIDFNPRAFRDQTRASIPESVLTSMDRNRLRLALVRTGVIHASDLELSKLFATNHGSARIDVDRLTVDERLAVLHYMTLSLAIIDRDLGPSNEYRKIFNSGRAPYVGVVVNGYGQVGYAVPSERGGFDIFEF